MTRLASSPFSSLRSLFLFFVVERIIVEPDELEEAGDAEGSGRGAGGAEGTCNEAGDVDRSLNIDDRDSSATKVISTSINWSTEK